MDDALNTLRAKLEEFRALPSRIIALRRRAERIATLAGERGYAEEQVKAAAVSQALIPQLRFVNATMTKLDDMLAALARLGVKIGGALYLPSGLGALPVIPVAIAAGAVAVAGAVTYAIAQYAKQESFIDAIERGVLTPEEYARIRQGDRFLGPLSRYLPWIAGGAVAFMLWRRKR